MQLSQDQRDLLTKAAEANGVDPAELIAAAEDGAPESGVETSKGQAPASTEPPKLFMYHLPFVRVREVRQIWLGLTEAFPGDEEIASEWAAKHGGGGAPVDPNAAPVA